MNSSDQPFFGEFPCINLLASSMKEEELVRMLISISKFFNLSPKKIKMVTVFMQQKQLIQNKYDESSLNALDNNQIINCNDMSNYITCKNYCNICRNSETYSNKDLEIEKKILAYMIQNPQEISRLKKLIKGNVDILYKSYVQIGVNFTSPIIQLNKLIFNTIKSNIFLNDDIDSMFLTFKNDNLLLLEEFNEDECLYIESYFKELNNPKFFKSELSEIESFISNLSPHKKKPLVQKKTEIIECEKTEVATSKQRRVKKKTANQDFSSAYTIESFLNEYDKNTKNKTISEPDKNENISILNSFFDKPIDITDITTINHITNEKEAFMFDFELLKNSIIVLDYAIYKDVEGLIIYLEKNNIYYFVMLNDPTCNDIIKFYTSDKSNKLKLTYYSLTLYYYFDKHKYQINNLISIHNLCNSNSSSDILFFPDVFKELNIAKENIKDANELRLLMQKYYVKIYNNQYHNLSSLIKETLFEQDIYEKVIARSLYINDISQYANQYIFNIKPLEYDFKYKDISSFSSEFILIQAKYLNVNIDFNAIIRAYIDILNKCYISGVYSKYQPRILQLSFDDGLIIAINYSSYRTFFTTLNRWMTNTGIKYISKHPDITIITTEIK